MISVRNFIALLCVILTIAQGEARAQPNIVVILADDMGYSDPGCFGGEIPTPSLDRLARDGTRLTRFHNASMCVVTRATMLTGKWWPRAVPAFEKTKLLPEHLKAAGYRTALIGKWHLKGHPMDRGFDHFFGFLNGFTDHFAGSASYRLDRAPFTEFGENYYSSDAFTDRAIKFAETESDQPFFLYLSYQAPHNPLQAPAEDIQRHRGKYLNGWQATREARFKRQQEIGIIPANTKLPTYPQNLPAWETLTDSQKNLEDLRMATYAAMVQRMDTGIGRLIASLEKNSQLENTLILFLSDNGTDPFSVVDKPMLNQGKLPGDPGSNWQPGTGWAYASVTPWRLYKISQHAGGTTTGAILHWPARTEKKGTLLHSPVHVIDILPTALDAIGQSVKTTDSSRSNNRSKKRDRQTGESFLSLLKDPNWQRNTPLYFQYMNNRAIREGNWTLAEVDGSGWEFFNTEVDPLETNDLAKTRRAHAGRLDAKWRIWWRRQSGELTYKPTPTHHSIHYSAQGDRGTGVPYNPTAMPPSLKLRYPLP